MNRLTMRNSDGTVSQPTSTTVEAVFYRLAEYEDTGLSPEDIKEIRKLVEIDQLKELLKAEAEERLVVLPCKVGDTVYEVHKWKDGSSFIVKSILAGIHLFDEKSRRNIPRKEYMVLRCNGFSKHIDLDKLGKTVFLSREEAEAALKGGES